MVNNHTEVHDGGANQTTHKYKTAHFIQKDHQLTKLKSPFIITSISDPKSMAIANQLLGKAVSITSIITIQLRTFKAHYNNI